MARSSVVDTVEMYLSNCPVRDFLVRRHGVADGFHVHFAAGEWQAVAFELNAPPFNFKEAEFS